MNGSFERVKNMVGIEDLVVLISILLFILSYHDYFEDLSQLDVKYELVMNLAIRESGVDGKLTYNSLRQHPEIGNAFNQFFLDMVKVRDLGFLDLRTIVYVSFLGQIGHESLADILTETVRNFDYFEPGLELVEAYHAALADPNLQGELDMNLLAAEKAYALFAFTQTLFTIMVIYFEAKIVRQLIPLLPKIKKLILYHLADTSFHLHSD